MAASPRMTLLGTGQRRCAIRRSQAIELRNAFVSIRRLILAWWRNLAGSKIGALTEAAERTGPQVRRRSSACVRGYNHEGDQPRAGGYRPGDQKASDCNVLPALRMTCLTNPAAGADTHQDHAAPTDTTAAAHDHVITSDQLSPPTHSHKSPKNYSKKHDPPSSPSNTETPTQSVQRNATKPP
jgi:hypothetical protein